MLTKNLLTGHAALETAGIRINCFGSTIANWGTSLDDDFAPARKTVGRAIKRMKKLKVPLIRTPHGLGFSRRFGAIKPGTAF
jgi:hypothetical protein